MKRMSMFVVSFFLLSADMSSAQSMKPERGHTITELGDEVRHQVLMSQYYGVFDWLEAQILPDDSVVLRGEVVRGVTKTDVVARVRKLAGVTNVVDQIEVLPASLNDDQLRRLTYRAILNSDTSLFEYATHAVSPIHIIVKGGHVTLEGVVNGIMDKQLVNTAASAVPGVFDVKNDLTIEK
jgi:hyperosmotically inducible periplasmic protein